MLVRLFLILFMVWVFLAELWNEVKLAPWYAWMECRIEFDAVRRAWRTKNLNIKD
jgi:hypothetical protein